MTINNIESGEGEAGKTRAIGELITEANSLRTEADRVTALIPAAGGYALTSYAVAGLPAATTAGKLIYVSNGDAGSPCLAVSNGTNWLRVALGAAVAAA